MDIHHILPAAAFALAVAGAAQADAPQAAEAGSIQAQPVAFGALSGVAHATAERDGLRVVATAADGETGTPLRVEAVLAPGQGVVLSTPREAGAAPGAVALVRRGDRVLVRGAAATNRGAAERGTARRVGPPPRPRGPAGARTRRRRPRPGAGMAPAPPGSGGDTVRRNTA